MAFVKKYGIAFVLLFMVITLSLVNENFLTPTNIFNALTQSSIFGIMALGMTLVIISRGIDLSVGSLLAFSGVVAASFAQSSSAMQLIYPNISDMPFILPVIVALAIGGLGGAINGSLIAFTGIHPFIATLGMMTIARGATLIYTKGKPISTFIPEISFLGSKIGIVPVPVIVYSIMIGITYILLNHTRLGKNAFAIGGNVRAAEVSGVNVKKNLVIIYMFMGICCGVAALVFMGRVGSVHPGAATGYELTAIAATTIGGTSQTGGVGTVLGAVVGALVLGVLRNGMTLVGVAAYWQQVVEGCIIIAAVVIDMRKNAKKK
jgi:inositol transport system permease protein